jgi:AraC-like DNA-binding protein
MISLETTAKVRRDHFVHGTSIEEISQDLGISRNSVRKILRFGDTSFRYERPETPMPKLDAFVAWLEAMLEVNEKRAKRDGFRLTRGFDDLRRAGYEGGYDAVRRHAQR